MSTPAQRSRSRASTEPYRHFSDGHVVVRNVANHLPTQEMIVRLYTNHRYCTPEYAAALLGRNYNATCVRFKALREDGVKVLKLCKRQQDNVGERLVGMLYSELDTEGYAILAEEGIKIKPRKEDGQFPHTLARDLATFSLEIGVKDNPDIEMEYRNNIPGSFRLGADHFMVCDERPITFTSKSRGTKRHLAGIEIETGANGVAPKDLNDASAIKKLRNMLWLMEKGELERSHHFGKQFYWAFVCRTDVRKESIMHELVEMTKHKPELRKHFIFKRHPIYGKSKDKPRATGHMFTEPWDRAGHQPLYLNGGEASARQ